VTGPDHPRFRDDAGAYLLHALEDDERRAYEVHMEGCSDCRDEVERLRLAADARPTTPLPPDRSTSPAI
jgi:anti-sigma factor RsiW